jgi:hypothetical protein
MIALDPKIKSLVLILLVASSSSLVLHLGSTKAQPLAALQATQPVNVITNASFEQGQQPCASASVQLCPSGWDFATCEGVANATITLDNTRKIDGNESAKVSTGPVTPKGCFPGDFTNRAVGFSQFRAQVRGQSYNFTTLTDDPQHQQDPT